MQFDEYLTKVADRYQNLTDDEKEQIRVFNQDPTLKKLLGPEFEPLSRMLKMPTPKEVQQEIQQEVEPPMNRGGFIKKPSKRKRK